MLFRSVFDVRFMDNPFYVEDLRMKSGADPQVMDFVFANPQHSEFVNKLTGFIKYLVPLFVNEGRSQLNISIGCTGGQHRSVAVVEKSFGGLSGIETLELSRFHRDLK